MFRFTVRELLLLTVIVAVGVAWRVDRHSRDKAWRACFLHLFDRLGDDGRGPVCITTPEGKTFNKLNS